MGLAQFGRALGRAIEQIEQPLLAGRQLPRQLAQIADHRAQPRLQRIGHQPTPLACLFGSPRRLLDRALPGGNRLRPLQFGQRDLGPLLRRIGFLAQTFAPLPLLGLQADGLGQQRHDPPQHQGLDHHDQRMYQHPRQIALAGEHPGGIAIVEDQMVERRHAGRDQQRPPIEQHGLRRQRREKAHMHVHLPAMAAQQEDIERRDRHRCHRQRHPRWRRNVAPPHHMGRQQRQQRGRQRADLRVGCLQPPADQHQCRHIQPE